MENILCLAIETSCDETSVSIVKNGREVLSNVIYSQIDIHKLYGGVVPEIASRNHVEKISTVIMESLNEANVTFNDLNIIGVTYGPGLVGALLVGVSAAKGIAYSLGKPLVPVHHIAGHIAANYIDHKDLKPPFIALVVSGGHSHLIHVKDYTSFEILGRTRDDAVGEAFDKAARVMGIGYPGGPVVDKLANKGKAIYKLPRTYFDNLDFSFSGIKTAVLNLYNKNKQINKEDLCASFEEAVTEMLVTNSIKALKQTGLDKLVLAGGVAANTYLRKELGVACKKNNAELFYPKTNILCTDNAAMIGCAAYYNYMNGIKADLNLNAIANLPIQGEI